MTKFRALRHAFFAAVLLGSLPCTALAADDANITPFQQAPAALAPDRAYLLLKTSTAKSGLFPIQHVLLRLPSEQELADFQQAKKQAYEAALPKLQKSAKDGRVLTIEEFEFNYKGPSNAFAVPSKKFLEDGEMRTILLAVPAGTYILYGVTVGDNLVQTCNCLGTVKFTAEAGIITDMGGLYADKVHKASPVPHLEDKLGEQMFQYTFVLGQALVPPMEGRAPASLTGLPMKTAQYEVVGQYYEPGATFVNRLAPVQGVLDYKRGRPVDVRTGKIVD